MLNGRALQRYRAGRKGDAVAQVEGALAALAGCPESDETPAYHRHYSRVVLCSNMTRVYVRTGDLAAARIWYARLAEAARALPAWQLAELNEFAVLLLEDGLEEAAVSFAEQRDRARAWLAPDLEADAEQLLGQTLFRLGRAREAYGCFRAAERLHAALGQDVFGMKVNAAFAALRGGMAAEAYSLFVEVEAGMEGVDAGEVSAAQALARAMGGERDLELEVRAEAGLFAEGAAVDARAREVAMLAEAVGREVARGLVERAVDSVGDGELAAEDGLGLWVREEARAMAEQARGVDDANVWWEIRRLEGVGEPVG